MKFFFIKIQELIQLIRERNELANSCQELRDRFICGWVKKDEVTLVRGNFQLLRFSKKYFTPCASGEPECTPDFTKPSIQDYGATVDFGGYDVGHDTLLLEKDNDFRQRRYDLLIDKRNFPKGLKNEDGTNYHPKGA